MAIGGIMPYKERSAKTGRYVRKGTEKKRPNTTVREKVKKRR